MTITVTSDMDANDEICLDQGRKLPHIESEAENDEFFDFINKYFYSKSKKALVLLGKANSLFILNYIQTHTWLPGRKFGQHTVGLEILGHFPDTYCILNP